MNISDAVSGVDVDAVLEGLLQRGDVGDMGEDAQFDLGVVEADQDAALGGHEGLADAAAFLGADGDVLQVRVGRGQAPGVGARRWNSRCGRGRFRG